MRFEHEYLQEQVSNLIEERKKRFDLILGKYAELREQAQGYDEIPKRMALAEIDKSEQQLKADYDEFIRGHESRVRGKYSQQTDDLELMDIQLTDIEKEFERAKQETLESEQRT